MKVEHEADDVFAITGDIPLNYVEREYVDEKLRKYKSKNKHLVIYGGSKQGKTCLRKHTLDEEDQVVIQCSNKWDISDIHSTILKEAGFKVTVSEKEAVSGTRKIKAGISSALDIGTESEEQTTSEKEKKRWS